MPQLTAVSNGQLSDASMWNQYRTLYRGGLIFDVVNGYGADNTGATLCTTAVRAANAAAKLVNGVVWFPPGAYRMDAPGGPTVIDSVTWMGAGKELSVINCPNSLGTGNYLLQLANNQSSNIENLGVNGPGARSLGVKTALCNGLQILGDRSWLRNVSFRQWDIALSLGQVGLGGGSSSSHNTFENVTATDSYYGVYIPGSNGGDNYFFGCFFDGCTFASIAAGGDNLQTGTTILQRCHLGFGPYGIYQEATSGAPTYTSVLGDALLLQCHFEAIGNGAIFSEEQNGASQLGAMQNWTIISPGFSWDPNFRIGSRNHDYCIAVNTIAGQLDIWGTTANFTSGDLGTIFAHWLIGPIRTHSNGLGDEGQAFSIVTDSFQGSFRVDADNLIRGSSFIPSASTSVLVTTEAVGSPGSLTPVVTPTSNGGLAGAFTLLVSNLLSSPMQPAPKAFTAAVGAAGNVNAGTHLYAATYVNFSGETTLGYASNSITAAPSQVNLSGIPTSRVDGAAISARKIYRTKAGTITPWFLVGTINDNTTTVFTDNIADASLGAAPPTGNSTRNTRFTVSVVGGTPGSNLNFNWSL